MMHLNLDYCLLYELYTHCFLNFLIFQVPVVTVESVASVDFVIRGGETSLNNNTKILIIPSKNLIFIQSDKPIYKPGQTSKILQAAMICLWFVTLIKCNLIPLQDPYSNRIGQWLNQATRIGILDLIWSEPGFSFIFCQSKTDQLLMCPFLQFFPHISLLVLPKYEVNISFPSIITILDKEVTLKVCAKYTYGKPVLGSVNAEVCGQSFEIYYIRPVFPDSVPICKKYSMMVRYPLHTQNCYLLGL
uniref:Macroglobulin domain-containing protein n=1 Tax=Cyprinus carpio TaxID=7962 RepID=A0A8C2PN26_CYPCA